MACFGNDLTFDTRVSNTQNPAPLVGVGFLYGLIGYDTIRVMKIVSNGKLLWVAGGRDYHVRTRVSSVLRGYADDGWTLITGAAPGADLLAEDLWREWQAPYVGIPAQWDRDGKPAGVVRNRVIGHLDPDLLIAFPGGRGTRDAINVAAERQISWLVETE